jgi:hypothetical protein
VRTQNEPTSKALIGQINAKFATNWSLPTTLKAGGKTQAGTFKSVNRTNSWTYVGPQNNRLTTEIPVTVGFTGVDPLDAGNIFDQFFQYPDRTALGRLQKANPEYFVPNPANATSTANLFPHRLAREYIDAAIGHRIVDDLELNIKLCANRRSKRIDLTITNRQKDRDPLGRRRSSENQNGQQQSKTLRHTR